MAAVPQQRLTTNQPGRHHLAAVADAFLPLPAGADSEGVPPGLAPGLAPMFAAAPGASDTASVLAVLQPDSAPSAGHDLGGAIGVRLCRLERDRSLARSTEAPPLLIWCPRGEEGLSLVAALALGRLGALLQPSHLTVLWFAGPDQTADRDPDLHHCQQASTLARAAIPLAAVSVHCLGWSEDAQVQLTDLARRFT